MGGIRIRADRLWSKLAEPSPRVVDPSDRRTARLLSRLLLVIVPLASLSAGLQLAGDGGLELFHVALALAIGALVTTYVLSRTIHFRVAAVVTTLIPTVGALGVLAADASDPGWFAFMALNPALGTLLLSPRWATLTAATNLVAVIGAVIIVTSLASDTVVVAVLFNAIVAAVLLTAKHHRDQLERDRQTELVARQRLNESVLAASFGGIALHRDGVILEANEAFLDLIGKNKADVEGTHLRDLFEPTSHGSLEDLLASSDGGPAELVARRLDGTTVDTEVLAPRRVAHDDTPDVLAIRDISERKRATDALLRAQRMESVSRLAAGIAHDTNNQLAVISANAEMLLRAGDRSDPEAASLETIRDAAEQIAVMLRRVLKAGSRRHATPVAVDLAAFVADLEPRWRDVVGEGIELSVRTDPATGHAFIDPMDLEQVLLNLVLNARDAMHGVGELTVDVGPATPPTVLDLRSGAAQVIAVSDTGEGIAPGHLDAVFEPFFTTKGEGVGTGLGLSTARDAVERAGGSLEVESGQRGTTFLLSLPGVEAGPESSEVAEPLDGRVVLLVDDVDAVRSALASMLRAEDFAVIEAASGSQAVDELRARGTTIDCVLTDLDMPGMNGDDLVRVVRAGWPGIVAVVMSGYGTGKESEEGAVALRKPFTAEDLRQAIGRVEVGDPTR